MTDTSHPMGLPSRYERPSAVAFLGYAAAIVIIFWSFAGAGFSIDKVVSSPPRFADFLDRAFPPNLEPEVLTRLADSFIELNLLQARARTNSIMLDEVDISSRDAMAIARRFHWRQGFKLGTRCQLARNRAQADVSARDSSARWVLNATFDHRWSPFP